MKNKGVWLLIACLLSTLLLVSCAGPQATAPLPTPGTPKPATPAATAPAPTTPRAEAPQYGGTLTLALAMDITTFDGWSLAGSRATDMALERLWDGDWAKGPAGGYGTNEAAWDASTNLRHLKAYYLAEDVSWTVDAAKKEVTTVIKVRKGIRWALDPRREASRLVNGRELTADDIAFNLTARCNDSRAMTFRFFPDMRGIKATKTGPSEVTLVLPMHRHLNGIMFLLDGSLIFAPEVLERYGDGMSSWANTVGTGPFMVTDFVPGSICVLERNPRYWMTDPVGPGKGNQLPYLDRVKLLVIPDVSTREAALRTAKLDQLGGFIPEAAAQMRRQAPALKEAPGGWAGEPVLFMRTDKAPYNDKRVRRALMMATDFNTINKSLYGGLGQILSWPFWYTKEYADLYLGLDHPDMPASVKELYVYNPEKAKQLLKEAGFPTGFKADLIMSNIASTVDYYSMIKSMYAKVGVDITLDLKEPTVLNTIQDRVGYENFTAGAYPPNASWPEAAGLQGITRSNASRIDDPLVNETVAKWNEVAITDPRAAMKITRDLMKYVLDQAWVIPTPRYPQYTFWWPWVKNYSGETTIGWIAWHWPRWVWVDQTLKKSMGY